MNNKPHTPTIAELEDLFREMDDDAPSNTANLRDAVRVFLYAWDEDIPIRDLSLFVEELRRALDGRS